jgi:hypothetical protein
MKTPEHGQPVWIASFTLKNAGEPAVNPQAMIAEMDFVSEGPVLDGKPLWILRPRGQPNARTMEHPASACWPTRQHAVYVTRKHIIDIVEKLAALLDATVLAIQIKEESKIVAPDGSNPRASRKIIKLRG